MIEKEDFLKQAVETLLKALDAIGETSTDVMTATYAKKISEKTKEFLKSKETTP